MCYWAYLFLSILFGGAGAYFSSIINESKVEGFVLGFFCWPLLMCFLSVFLLVVGIASLVRPFMGDE